MSTEQLAQATIDYSKHITVYEPKEAATSWHAHRLCRHCGSCVLYGVQSENCPKKLKPEQVVLSPQGFGPARNIAAFTGGDIMCKPEFYIEYAKKVKKELDDFWILLESNGYGLTPKNLEAYAAGGIDAFWLDIKAYSGEVYRKLCGTSNEQILESVQRIIDLMGKSESSLSPTKISKILKMNYNTAKKYLEVLNDLNMVTILNDNKTKSYSLNHENYTKTLEVLKRQT